MENSRAQTTVRAVHIVFVFCSPETYDDNWVQVDKRGVWLSDKHWSSVDDKE